MASFSFDAGNARKIAALPLYLLGRVATMVIPRSKDEWVVGCGAGIGDGALALWDEVSREGHSAVWLIGSRREAQDAAARGIPTVPKSSLAGFWRTARARVIVVTHGFGDVNRYAVSGAFVAQLWHGIPLKRIGLDSPETLRVPARLGALAPLARRIVRFMFRRATREIDIVPAASHLVRGRIESAFALPDRKVAVTGEPRVDVLSRGTAAERHHAARSIVSSASGQVGDARLVLYAPTWRDGEQDPAVPSADEWRTIIDVLDRHDAILLVRSHPLGLGDYLPPHASRRVRPLGSDRVRDVTPVLPALTALVTDYSSLAFDAALVPVPTVYLAPDIDAYARRRGFYGRYGDVAGDDVAADWTQASAQLDAVLGDPREAERRAALSRDLSSRVHAFRDGRNSARVYRAILAGLTQRRAKGHP